ncbi:MAG: carbon-nitrogen hydrolase family protein [Paraclostridium sp.]|uniref:carbon-nitrogen hydrolase family protein n=1 Tax=Paraclostridium sp. TaxID=2023273 RepID=UPI003F39B66A
MSKCKLAIIQMIITDDKIKNLEILNCYLDKLSKNRVDIVVLPEMFCCPYVTKFFPLYAECEGGATYTYLSKLAKKYNIYLVAGSMPEVDEHNKIYNTSYVFDRNGDLIGKHRKIHLFDMQINDKFIKESNTITPGSDITVFDTEFGKFGLCICYDLRFTDIFNIMVAKGAKAIIVPAAFNMKTGPSHWDLLFKCRAIDNQVYTIGCAPARNVNDSYISFGNSIVVSPWGDIVNKLDEKEGYFICDLDFDYVDKIRKEFPFLNHRKNHLYK